MILQLNQSNLLLTPFHVHKIQFISNKLRPFSSSHGQLRKLVFLFSHRGSHFLKRHTRLFVKPYRQSDLALLFFSLMTNVLVQSLNKMHMKYVLHNKFRMIIFHDQKALSLNFKSSHLRMFFKIDV